MPRSLDGSSTLKSEDGSGNEVPSKTKIAERLSKAVDGANMTKNKNRSPDLIPLTEEYESMKKKLRKLITVVKTYSEKMESVNTARNDLVEHLSFMSTKSPIYDSVGGQLDHDAVEELKSIETSSKVVKTVEQVGKEWKKRKSKDVYSLQIVSNLGSTQTAVNSREYKEHVIDYIIEWEKVVTERVDAELKKVRKLQGDRTHYERKVESLRQQANTLQAKGKTSPASATEKLERNEEKLRIAFQLHEADASRLCILIEAATKDGWKDLFHLVKNYIKFESNRVGRENDIICELSGTLTAMKSNLKENNNDSNSNSTNNNKTNSKKKNSSSKSK